ncbi:MAG: glycosyltransferase family 4 protein [Chitinophagaceae bacterium]
MQQSTNKIKIAYLSVNDPLDKRSWSGTTYYIGQTLKRNVGEVHFLGPVPVPKWLDKLLRAISKLIRILFKKEYTVKYSLLLSWYFARVLQKKMRGQQYDLIVAPAASTEVAFFSSSTPIIFISDTTFALISNYYKNDFEQICALSRWEGNYIENRSLVKSAHLIYSSKWAAQSAVKDYFMPAEKITVMPLAANMDTRPARAIIFDKQKNRTLTLLYLAVEWERKGGSIAFDTLIQLEKMGVQTRLIVCGCTPPSSFVHASLEVIPFLNKNVAADHERFIQILSSVHFLLLPTRADCSLLVACEANAYGVPAITTQTGGVPDIVVNDVNGYCLPYAAGGDAYASLIAEIFHNEPRYHQLILSSRERFETELNWDKWAERFKEMYQMHFSKKPSGYRKQLNGRSAVD